jgi:hypothetical protein
MEELQKRFEEAKVTAAAMKTSANKEGQVSANKEVRVIKGQIDELQKLVDDYNKKKGKNKQIPKLKVPKRKVTNSTPPSAVPEAISLEPSKTPLYSASKDAESNGVVEGSKENSTEPATEEDEGFAPLDELFEQRYVILLN